MLPPPIGPEVVGRRDLPAALGNAALAAARALAGRADRWPAEEFTARLSGTTSPYHFTEAIRTHAGAWADGPRSTAASGMLAHELNGASGLGGQAFTLWPGPGDYRFEAIRSGTTTSYDYPVVGYGCPCDPLPTSIYLVVAGSCDMNLFRDCKFTYGPTPPEYSTLSLGPNAFLSTETFTDMETGDPFRYYLSCDSLTFNLTRVYPTSIFGTPLRDIERYRWSVPGGSNQCTPLYLPDGVIYSGGDLGCHLALYGPDAPGAPTY